MNVAVAIVSDRDGWHCARLREAFSRCGVDAVRVPLLECALEAEPGKPGVRLPAFLRDLPSGVFVRGVPGGTLEEIVFCLDILHGLRELGVPVYNDARGVERSVDKGMTSLLLYRAGVPTPPAWTVRNPALARSRWLAEAGAGHRMVVKPLFGSQGEGLVLLKPGDPLPDSQSLGGVYYLQRYVEPAHDLMHDWRVFVVGGRAVAAMAREGECWINNVARGARCRPAALDKPLSELAEQAVKALDLRYGGVDIVCDASGSLLVIEVNSIPAWRGLQSVASVDIATLLAEDFLRHCHSGPRREAMA